MRANVLMLAVVIAVAFVQYANACSCRYAHPQVHYCNSDFVILARVKNSFYVNSTYGMRDLIYKVRIRKFYKQSEKASVALKSGRLITAEDPALCRAELEPNRLYVISGRIHSLKAHINYCGMAKPWSELTRRQRRGLKSIYKHGCSCKVKYCGVGPPCRPTPDACNYTNHCHADEGICMRGRSGKCMWTRNKALVACLKDTNSPFRDDRGRRFGR